MEICFRSGVYRIPDVRCIDNRFSDTVLITLIRKKTTWKNALAAGAAFGTATELLQLAIAAIQGFSFRYIDTADIICNLAGTMLGWMLTALLIRFLQKSKPANVGEKSLYAYISGKCVKQ